MQSDERKLVIVVAGIVVLFLGLAAIAAWTGTQRGTAAVRMGELLIEAKKLEKQ